MSIWALCALISFILALFKVAFPVDLVVLGLVFVSLHLLWPVGIPVRAVHRS